MNTIPDFLSFRKQRVVLKGKVLSLTNIKARVPQVPTLTQLILFLICINDLCDILSTNAKVFADNTSLFSALRDVNTSATHLNDNLNKISN